MPEKWIEVKVATDPHNLEDISSYLFALGCDGITEAQDHFLVYFPQHNWSRESLLMVKSICVAADPTAEITLAEIKAENWNENWMENFRPLKLTDSCVIVPDWEKNFDAGAAHKIIISPKMAFGTGYHETTQLILMLLPDYITPGMQILDAGTGSAILSIFAAQLGAKRVLAFDNDPVAIENALENVSLNCLEDYIECRTGLLNLADGKEFDLILANINRNVLLDLASGFADYLAKSGHLILSGLLDSDETKIRAAYEEVGFKIIERRQKGEWLALVCQH